MKKEIIKKVLTNTLVNILAIILTIIALTFITLLCWNHIAAVFSLFKLHFIDIFCIFSANNLLFAHNIRQKDNKRQHIRTASRRDVATYVVGVHCL